MKKYNVSLSVITVGIVILLIMGIGMGLFHWSPMMAPMNDAIFEVFWGDGTPDNAALQGMYFMFALGGLMLLGLAIMSLFIVRGPLKRKEKWAWYALVIPYAILFIADELFSLYYGVNFNAIANIGYYGLVLVPLFTMRKEYFQKR